MASEGFKYLSATSVQCPRCGNARDVQLYTNNGYTLDYSGVCTTEINSGVFCGVSLTLRVTAHLFPTETK